MATPSDLPLAMTGDPLVDAAIHGYYWNLGADRTLRWAIADGFSGEFWTDPLTTAGVLEQAFEQFAYFADIRFEFAGYYDTPGAAAPFADLTVSMDGARLLFDEDSVWALGFFPNSAYSRELYPGAPGDVFLNLRSEANFLESYDPGSAGFFLMLHELGHTIGLKHPHDDGGTGRPTLASFELQDFDSDWFTVMSYADDYNWNLTAWDPASPMLLDVIGLQYLYGPNMETNAGDGTYDLTLFGNLYETVWDAGGVDWVSAETAPEGWTIILPEEQLSSLVPIRAGLAVPSAEIDLDSPKTFVWLTGDIEHAIGSAFADSIFGSVLDNFLDPGAGDDEVYAGEGNDVLFASPGDDLFDGGEGSDALLLSGPRANYLIQKSGGIWLSLDTTGVDGLDAANSIEMLAFDDVSIPLVWAGSGAAPQYAADPAFLFDPAYYALAHTAELSGYDAETTLAHYLSGGAAQGNAPNGWFDAAYYQARWPDLSALTLDAATLFAHYNLYGVWEGRSGGPAFHAFDGARYLADNPDVAAYVDAFIGDFLGSRSNGAIAHYVIYGADEGRAAFDLGGVEIDLGYVV